MERVRARKNPELPLRLPRKSQEVREKILADLLKSNVRLNFYIFWKSPNVISVGVRGRKYGMWLFDANSQAEIKQLAKEGYQIPENPLDLILEGESATIDETETKLPTFIAKYYPQLRKKIPQTVSLKFFRESSPKAKS